MRFLVVCFVLVFASSLLSVEGKAVNLSSIPKQLCGVPVECFVDPCSVAACDGTCTRDCYCNAICS